MNRLSVVAVLLLVSVGCAGPGSSPTPTSPPTSQPSSQPTSQPTPTGARTLGPIPTVGESAILAKIPTADGPIVLAATDDTVWVENHRSNIVSRIDPAQNKETERLEEATVHCEVAAGAGYVWAAMASASSFKKIDPDSGEVLDSKFLTDACGVAAGDDDVWVTSPGLGKVVRFDPETLEEMASVALGQMVFGVAIGPEAVWVIGEASGGTVYRVDPATNEVVTTISVALGGYATGITAGQGSVWVPARDKRVIYRIDPATNTVVATIQMPSTIGGVGVGPDAVWSSGFGDGTVYRIDPATNAITGSVSTGQGNLGPPLYAFDSLWVGALDRNVVLRIDPAAIR